MKSLLKFITCGSVDDGKSTLIGHMLYDAKLLFADQERSLELDSRIGSRSGKIDYSLLLDGLMAEREQGITIDVAYRYFTTEHRSFIVADTPGHEQYTRNMAVGAAFAELAVILVDAVIGLSIQTRRHVRICAFMGIRNFVFAVNKMDLVQYEKKRFQSLETEIKDMISEFEINEFVIIPVSATEGDNITRLSANMSWYQQISLLEYLENVEIKQSSEDNRFILPIQRVCRPNHTFRGFQGQVESGKIAIGDKIYSIPGKSQANIKELYIGKNKVNEVLIGQPVTISLDNEIDVSRGCVLTNDSSLSVSNLFRITLLWMDDMELVVGRSYLLKLSTQTIPAVILDIKYKTDVNTGDSIPVKKIKKNEIAACDIQVSEKIVYDSFQNNKVLGGFILIDRISNMTSACGRIEYALRRADNVTWQKESVTKEIRSQQKGQKPFVLWFTGLSGSGKSTLANEVEKRLTALGKHTMLLDGDNVRMGLNKNLGFEENDRIENVRRIAEVTKLMNDAGLIVLTALISPYGADRDMAREIIQKANTPFIEVYINTPPRVCEGRDVKGLYKKAKMGLIPNFTGVSSPYEKPQDPDLAIDTSIMDIGSCADFIMNYLEKFL